MPGVKGRSGRKPKPSAVHRASGDGFKVSADEPKPERSSLVAPEYLSSGARKAWDRAAKDLDACGILTNVDEAALAHYCEQFALWQEAVQHIKRNGMLLTSKKTGSVVPNPSIRIANSAHDRLVKMMVEFGMTPSSRARVRMRPGYQQAPADGSNGKPINRFAALKASAKLQ